MTLPLLLLLAADLQAFRDVSAEAGLDVQGGEAVLAFGDYDADGDPDLLVDGRRLFRNDSAAGAVRFVDVTQELGLAAKGPGGCWFDFDLDGRLDLGTRSGEVWLQGADGRFHDFSVRLGVTLPTGSASAVAWGDLDGDGWLDLVAGGNNTYDPLTHYAQSAWLNTPRKKPLTELSRERDLERVEPMRDASAQLGVTALAYGRAVVLCDFDWDGDDDVYSGNYHLEPNFLYRNDGGALVEVGEAYGVAGLADPAMFTIPGTDQQVGYRHGHTIGAAWADLTNDGYFDLWVANLVHKYAGPASEELAKVLGSDFDVRGYLCDDSNVFVNQGPPAYRFEDERVERGIPRRPIGPRGVFTGDELWSNAVCADVDNDGWLDVFCNQVYGDLEYSHGVLYENDGGAFHEVHEAAGVKVWGGYGGAFADLDSDGWPDLVVAGAAAPKGERALHVFLNPGGEAPWLGLDVRPEEGVQTVGAKVLLVQAEGVQVRQLATTTGSHTQQNDGRVHFGLGSGGAVRDVLVYWPDGAIQSLGPLAAGEYHLVRRRSLPRKRFALEAPAEVRAGQPLELAVTDLGKGFTYAWDWRGSRAAELETETPAALLTLDEPGTYALCVRGVRVGRQAFEARATLVVTE